MSSKPAPGLPAPRLSDGKNDPECGVCGGYGYVSRDLPVGDPGFGKLHPCPACGHLAAQERARRLHASKQKRIAAYTVTRPEQTFETFNTRDVSPSIRTAYHAALRFAEAPRGWLVLHGPPGTGKSHLAGAIVNRCSERLAISLIMPDLLELLRSGYTGGDYDEVLDLCRTVELLVLDDMGTESPTAWTHEKLFQILNHRYNQALPTVLVFNGAVDDFEPRIASRMKDRALSTVAPVYGADYRERSRR